MPGDHFHEPRAAGEFVAGLPKASAGFGISLLPGISNESLQADHGSSAPTPVHTPKAKPPPCPSPTGSFVDESPEVVFTIEYGTGWKFCLENVAKNFNPKTHIVLGKHGDTFKFCDWHGTLDYEPEPHQFPLRLVRRKTFNWDGYGDGSATLPKSTPAIPTPPIPPQDSTPEVETPKEDPLLVVREPKHTAVPKPPSAPSPSAVAPTLAASSPSPSLASTATVKAPPAVPATTGGGGDGSGGSKYADGTYWKKLRSNIK